MMSYEWKDVYKKLADELNIFYKKSSIDKSIAQQFFDLCNQKEYRKEFHTLFGWSKNITQNSIDPFHIFASFNNSGTTLENKKKRLQFYFKVLNSDNTVENIDDEVDNRFSVPHIAIVYVVADRLQKQQNEIWDFFNAVMDDNEPIIEEGFNNYENWFGIGFTVITELLFWINSDKYISLDKNTSKIIKTI